MEGRNHHTTLNTTTTPIRPSRPHEIRGGQRLPPPGRPAGQGHQDRARPGRVGVEVMGVVVMGGRQAGREAGREGGVFVQEKKEKFLFFVLVRMIRG